MRALAGQPVDVRKALSGVVKPSYIGFSYGSKHLRFLCPQQCPVLDLAHIVKQLGYAYSVDGYFLWTADCLSASEMLETSHVPNPMERPVGRWYPADVDMAVFAHLQGW